MTDNKEIRIENSTICNNACVFCPNDSLTRGNSIMSYELFEFLIKKIKQEEPSLTNFAFSGMGEMFTDKSIMEKIRLIKDMGYIINILTNGSLLTDEIIDELIDLEINTLRISFHSANKETYTNIMKCPEDQWDKVLDNIYKISDRKKDKIRLVVTADLLENIEEETLGLRNLLEDKVNLLEIWKPHNWTTWGSYREGKTVKKTCNRPLNGPLQIQVDGTVNMCCFDYDGKLLLGDLKTQTLKEIFTSPEYLKIKKIHDEGTTDKSDLICNGCDQLKDSGDIVCYNNKFTKEERIKILSTTYNKV